MELTCGPLLAMTGLPPGAAATDDAALMLRWRRGDASAFKEIYRRHRAPLYRFIVRLVPRRADADEIFQDVWLAVVKGRERYAPTARFATFLFAIAYRRIADAARKGIRRPEAPMPDEARDDAIGPEGLAEGVALGAALSAAIAALAPEQREVFLLRAEGDLSVEEIAIVTGAPYETAKSRLKYANRHLRQKLEAWK